MRVVVLEIHHNYYRVSRERFDELLDMVRPQIEHKKTHKLPISANERLSITLRSGLIFK